MRILFCLRLKTKKSKNGLMKNSEKLFYPQQGMREEDLS